MFIFHHIPKTAGSTFNHAVVDANQGVARIVGAGGLSAAPNVDLTSVRFLCGHVTFEEAVARGLGRDSVHVSILRDPLKRIVSHFEMAFRDNEVLRTEICAIDKWKFGFEVFLRSFSMIAGNGSREFGQEDKQEYIFADIRDRENKKIREFLDEGVHVRLRV